MSRVDFGTNALKPDVCNRSIDKSVKVVKIDLINIDCIDHWIGKIDDTLKKSVDFIDWFWLLPIPDERNICL